jgi:hypothetical protein
MIIRADKIHKELLINGEAVNQAKLEAEIIREVFDKCFNLVLNYDKDKVEFTASIFCKGQKIGTLKSRDLSEFSRRLVDFLRDELEKRF